MKDLCLTCGRESLKATLERNFGICEKCKNDERSIVNIYKDLECAIYSNNYDIVFSFISNDKNHLNKLIKKFWYPIHYASYLGKQNSLCAIIELGENIERDYISEYNHTPLYISVEHNHYECAELLLNNNANPNVAEDFYLTTPLHMAAKFNFAEMAQLLLRYNANKNAIDHENKTPLHIALENNNMQLVKILN